MQKPAGYHGPRRTPARWRPILRGNRPIILHVTVCTTRKRQILANREVHDALLCAWSKADRWQVGTYVIMPEHCHLFCSPASPTIPSLRNWVGYWKRLAGDELSCLKSAWIRDCWDTQMRSQGHYLRKLGYVKRNPVRRGLVPEAELWPYQGTMSPLNWISG